MKWIIYKHTNKINGKCYIGQTKQLLEERWKNGLGYNPYDDSRFSIFWSAIKKYGWSNFNHEILEANIPSQELANKREIFYIEKYKSYVGFENYNGYNMTLGGDSKEHLGSKVYQINKELKIVNLFNSISIASVQTNISKSGIGNCCRGNKITAGGYYWCFENSYSKDWFPKSNSQYVPVYQIDPDKKSIINFFNSINDAAKKTNTNYQSIIQCCKRKTAKANGFYWCYPWDFVEDWVPEKKERRKKIYCIETCEVFSNAKEAALAYNCNYQHILHCCNNLTGFNSVGGYHWCFYRDKDSYTIKIDKDTSPVYCVNTKTKYNSINEAANLTGTQASSISLCCRKLRKTANGLTWCYEKDYNESLQINSQKERRIICLETGIVYPSITLASKETKTARGSLSNHLIGKNKTAGGYHWKYLEK